MHLLKKLKSSFAIFVFLVQMASSVHQQVGDFYDIGTRIPVDSYDVQWSPAVTVESIVIGFHFQQQPN